MPKPPAPEADDRGPIQSIDRAAAVLGLLDENTRTLTAAFVASRLGLNRTTAHRYLNALQGAGFLTAGNAPGPLIDQLSALVSPRQQLLTLAPAVLRRLSDRVGLTAVLSFPGRNGAVVAVVEEASEGTIILTIRVGTALETRAAQSRVFFAYQSNPDAVARMLHSLPPAEAQAEQAELAKVRRDGVAWADLRRFGLESAAAPVFGAAHEVVAAVGLLGTTTTLAGAEGEPRLAALRGAADELSTALAG